MPAPPRRPRPRALARTRSAPASAPPGAGAAPQVPCRGGRAWPPTPGPAEPARRPNLQHLRRALRPAPAPPAPAPQPAASPAASPAERPGRPPLGAPPSCRRGPGGAEPSPEGLAQRETDPQSPEGLAGSMGKARARTGGARGKAARALRADAGAGGAPPGPAGGAGEPPALPAAAGGEGARHPSEARRAARRARFLGRLRGAQAEALKPRAGVQVRAPPPLTPLASPGCCQWLWFAGSREGWRP